MSKNKIILLFPDGVGIRNYLYSNVFKSIDAELVLWHNFDDDTIQMLKKEVCFEDNFEIPIYKESLRENFLRELICLSRLRYNAKKVNNDSILSNWNWSQKGIFKYIYYKTIQIISLFFKSYDAILSLEIKYHKVIRSTFFYNEIKKLLQEVQPNQIFCSHQRALKVAPIFAAAKDLGIPTTTVIYSWDNLPKARMALRADTYWVWSEYMKNEMATYYPEISQNSIVINGAPQFEFYEDKNNIIDKNVFYNTYQLDLNKKIICFSGDDEFTSPDDPKYLLDVSQEITKAGLEGQYQILLRRCPIDLSGRFDSVIKKYPNLIKEATPIWNFNTASSWTTIYPTFDDVKLLVSTAFYSDIVINLGSTMAFDFAMFKKPCVFINYDQENKTISDWSVKTIYNFQHFRSMPSKEAVIWLNSKNEIIDRLIHHHLYENQEAMEDWCKKILN